MLNVFRVPYLTRQKTDPLKDLFVVRLSVYQRTFSQKCVEVVVDNCQHNQKMHPFMLQISDTCKGIRTCRVHHILYLQVCIEPSVRKSDSHLVCFFILKGILHLYLYYLYHIDAFYTHDKKKAVNT